MVESEDGEQRFTMADIPGIIEGASEGKGLGLEFLRHISRTRLLVYVLDVTRDPVEELRQLQNELRAYDATLLDSVAAIALNKTELVDTDITAMVEDELATFGLPVLPVSAKEGLGLPELRDALFQLLPDRELWAQTHALEEDVEDVREEPLTLTFREDAPERGAPVPERVWEVHGGGFEARLTRFSRHLEDAAEYLSNLFKRQGLYAALKRAGAREGDTVEIGTFRFEYFNDEE